jgi:hypothetical protein
LGWKTSPYSLLRKPKAAVPRILQEWIEFIAVSPGKPKKQCFFWLAKSHSISYDFFDEHSICIHNLHSLFAWAVCLISYSGAICNKTPKENDMKTSTSTFTPSRWRRVFCSLFLVAAVIAAVGAFASSRTVSQDGFPVSSVAANKIAPWVMEHTANGQKAEFVVVLANQAELSQAANLPNKAEKGPYVYNTLLDKSRVTQKPILEWLRERGLEYRSFYIVNAVLVKGTREIAEALAARPDVARIEGNPLIHNELFQPRVAVEALQPQAPKTIEPGIAYTHAPDVWALGFTGQGIVVGSLDSGSSAWNFSSLPIR